MDRLTVRLDDEAAQWVEQQAEQRDRSRSYIIAECVDAARSDADRSDPPRAEANRVDTQRLAELEAEIDELRDRVDELEADRSDTRQTVGSSDPEPQTQAADPGGSVSKTTLQDADSGDDLRGQLRSLLEAEQPVERRQIRERLFDAEEQQIKFDSWWRRHARPALKALNAEFTRNQGWRLPQKES